MLSVSGATLDAAAAGYGRDGKIHAAHFFKLAGQAMQMTFVVSVEAGKQLFARIEAETCGYFM